MNPLEFEKLIKPLSREKYHISRAIKFKDNTAYIDEWVIYRKDMPLEEFYDSNNIPVLSPVALNIDVPSPCIIKSIFSNSTVELLFSVNVYSTSA